MAPRAQLTQERSRARRDLLLEAAVALLGEGGTRAVTHRAVSIRAGLPPSTTVYYFATIEDLLHEAIGHHVREWIESMRRLTALEPRSARALLVDAEEGGAIVTLAFTIRTTDVVARELAIYLAGARDPELREEAAQALACFEEVVEGLLGLAGVRDAGDLAVGLSALIFGTALRRQSGRFSDAEEGAYLARAMRALVAAHVLDDDVLEEALSGLDHVEPQEPADPEPADGSPTGQ